jgi:hypothetical protein
MSRFGRTCRLLWNVAMSQLYHTLSIVSSRDLSSLWERDDAIHFIRKVQVDDRAGDPYRASQAESKSLSYSISHALPFVSATAAFGSAIENVPGLGIGGGVVETTGVHFEPAMAHHSPPTSLPSTTATSKES